MLTCQALIAISITCYSALFLPRHTKSQRWTALHVAIDSDGLACVSSDHQSSSQAPFQQTPSRSLVPCDGDAVVQACTLSGRDVWGSLTVVCLCRHVQRHDGGANCLRHQRHPRPDHRCASRLPVGCANWACGHASWLAPTGVHVMPRLRMSPAKQHTSAQITGALPARPLAVPGCAVLHPRWHQRVTLMCRSGCRGAPCMSHYQPLPHAHSQLSSPAPQNQCEQPCKAPADE